ncbi:Splicing factor U2AF-associated protein 2 [Smittium culicis]|uniref:Splicing factor U2AF-associated protein 2 n=1 Tax=Smittium culicis TaxID=133412 RepID=A0A1R1XLP1_9FUNG|nr:Splicing factor U2AF-associated protein 2 [Smittium culicis]
MDKIVFPEFKDFKNDARVRYELETDKYVFKNDSDLLEYEYDINTNAWFPRWNESLINQQQSIYTPAEPELSSKQSIQAPENFKLPEDKKRPARENTIVYVTGLPLDTTLEEVETYFKKCGTIMPDLITGAPRIKLYKDDEGNLKGDALVTYYKAPSVKLAIDILDDSVFRYSEPNRIKVQEAKFTEKTHSSDTKAVKKVKIDPSLVKKKINQLKKKLEWDEDIVPAASEKYSRVVVLVGMFTQKEIEEDVTLLIDLKEEIREECEKVGQVTNVKIFESSEEGLVTVKFKDTLGAQAAVQLLNGRFFAGRQIEAFICYGKIKLNQTTIDPSLDGPDYKLSSAEPIQGSSNEKSKSDSNDSSNKMSEQDSARLDAYAKYLENEQ